MSATPQGYILKIPADRIEVFHHYNDIYRTFAEPVPRFSYGRGIPLIVFIELEPGAISHIASGHPGVNAGSDLRRLNISKTIHLETPLRFKEILNRVPKNISHHIKSVLKNGGILPQKSFVAFTNAIIELDPQTKEILERFTIDIHERIKKLPPAAVSSLASQKEAINTALELANIDRDHLLEWTLKSDTPTSFLDGLSQTYLREDAMILNDMNYIPGMEKIRSSIHGIAQFNNGAIRLDVLYANRTRLEEQTGTDLIYYNVTYRSFVMVQYKAMEYSPAIFRLPNKQLNLEIKRMDALLDHIATVAPSRIADSYRLLRNPFFLKICRRIVLNPDTVELTPGMYFSLDHWKLLEDDPRILNPIRGKAISYDNAGRYLTNTEFAGLVQKAWVGTTPDQSAILEPLISQILSEGKSVIFAIKSGD